MYRPAHSNDPMSMKGQNIKLNTPYEENNLSFVNRKWNAVKEKTSLFSHIQIVEASPS